MGRAKLSTKEIENLLKDRGLKIKLTSECAGTTKPVSIKFTECKHETEVRLGYLLYTTNPDCRVCKPVKKTKASFQKEINQTHPHIRLVKYGGSVKEKAEFKCNLDGHVWSIAPTDFHGCKKCADRARVFTFDAFLDDLKRVNKTVVCLSKARDYSSLEKTENLAFKCLDCKAQWETSARSAKQNKYKCPHCAAEHQSKVMTLSPNVFKRRMKKINDRIELLEEYTVAANRIKVKCISCGHVWKPLAYSLSCGVGCPVCSMRSSKIATDWIDECSDKLGLSIKHIHSGSEFSIKGTRYRADGYIKKYNLVLEFFGDYWHGNPKTKHGHSDEGLRKYGKTLRKVNALLKLGYPVLYIWEDQYSKKKKGTLIVPENETILPKKIQKIVSKVKVQSSVERI